MTETKSILSALFGAIADAVAIPAEVFAKAYDEPYAAVSLLRRLGWAIPWGSAVNGNATSLQEAVQSLNDLLVDGATLADMAKVVGDIAVAEANLVSELGLDLSLSTDFVEALREDLPSELSAYALIAYLYDEHPALAALLSALGIFVIKRTAPESPFRMPYSRPQIRWDLFQSLLGGPTRFHEYAYDWGTPHYNGPYLLDTIHGILAALGLRVGRFLSDGEVCPTGEIVGEPIYADFVSWPELSIGLEIYEVEDQSRQDAGLAVAPALIAVTTESFEIGDAVTVQVSGDLQFRRGFGIELWQQSGINVFGEDALSAAEGEAYLSIIAAPPEPLFSIGKPDSTMFALRGARAGLWLSVKDGEADFGIEIGLDRLELTLSAKDADSFLKSLLSDLTVSSAIDLVFGLALNRGLYLQGSGALELEIPNHRTLGPVTLHSIHVEAKPEAGQIALQIGASFGAELGPLSVSVERMGLRLDLGLEEGNLGPVNVDAGFLAPTGIGLAINGGGFTGGGFLSFDLDAGRYVGILELAYQHTIALKAIGLLNTKVPGADFSLLIIISGEFPPIQLGYGFTLNGAGGLLGLNRSLNLDVLAEGIKSGSLESILFPQDPVANAAQIIGDLEAIFPSQPDQFVFGPMARIGWGVPTLITIDLGLVLEVPTPARLAILGVLRCLLPAEDEAEVILRLQAGFVGAIDFGAQELSFNSSIYDSRLLTMALSGDIAFRLRWGSDPCFLVSVGGFHPAFQPPANLAKMSRITINILGSDNPRLMLEGYFAITSNTVQFGAKVELYASACGCKIHGFLGFDVLLQFSPFHFIAEIQAGVAVSVWGYTLMSVFLKGTLSGPTPWNAKGEASFKILFVRFSVHFDKTFGESVDTTFPDVEVWPLLQDALLASGNWRAELPGRREPLVTLKTLPDDPDRVIVHPFGILSVSQKVVPLDLTISRFGNARPVDLNRFSITDIQIGESHQKLCEVRDEFARAQFVDLSDDARLALPSFEKLKSGVRFQASEALIMPDNPPVKVPAWYHDDVTDVTDVGVVVSWDAGTNKLPPGDFDGMIAGGSAARSDLAVLNDLQSPLGPANLYLHADTYAVVNMADMNLFNQAFEFPSYAEAADALSTVLAQRPDLSNTVQVVPACEML